MPSSSLVTPMVFVVVVVFFFLSSSVSLCLGAGAGRAFPMASENYIIQSFQRINPRLEWDPSNFLVDLSGQYAICRLISSRGEVKVDRSTPEGASVVGFVDFTDGSNADVNSVNGYLKRIIDRWQDTGSLNAYILSAERFGCSVSPGCNGRIAVSCLFSPGEDEGIPNPHVEGSKALAFTSQQYQLSESVTGNPWDRSYFLENLSGMETDCAMIGSRDWPFTKAREYETKYRLRLLGNYGYERNQGSTPDALEKILRSMKRITYAKRVGCSLIPDCIYDRHMYVVVSCLYEY